MEKLKKLIVFFKNRNTADSAAGNDGFVVLMMIGLLAVLSAVMGAFGKLYYLSSNGFMFASTGFMILMLFVFAVRELRASTRDMVFIISAILLMFLKIYLNYMGNWHPEIESAENLKNIPVLYVLAKNFNSLTFVFDGIIVLFIIGAFWRDRNIGVRDVPPERPVLHYIRYVFICSLFLFFAALIYRTAWVAEDAYISFRTVDNFVNGYGLTWNVEERVQTFTNPLWVLFFSIFYVVTKETFFTSIIITAFLTLAAVYLIFFKSRGSFFGAVLAVFLLAASKPFMEYTTSGLENALGYLIAAVFFIVYFKMENNEKKMFFLSLTAALGALNRLDLILVFIPALIHLFFVSKNRKRAFAYAATGFVPLAAWLVFAFFYYGYFFPNTYYAKMLPEMSTGFYWKQGIYYIRDSLQRDIVTLPVIGAVFIAALVWFDRKRFIVALSALLYVFYTIKMGGCFMTGRFLSVPFLLAVIAAADFRINIDRIGAKAVLIIVLLFSAGAGSEWSHLINGSNYAVLKKDESHYGRFVGRRGIADERGYYVTQTGLFNSGLHKEMPVHGWAEGGKNLRKGTKKYYEQHNIGMSGFFAGPDIYIVDVYGLADPFLARMPVKTVRIGHFYRELPEGYFETVSTGKNVIADPGLREYYEKIKLIARGPVFDPKRLKTAINMNLGNYEYLKEEYVENYRR